jgi:LysM repeat protein
MSLAATPLVIAALVVSLSGGGASASLSGSTADFQYVTVASGETLWQVAEQLAPSADPRDVIAEIVRLNQLTTPDLFAGQELAIPSQYAQK